MRIPPPLTLIALTLTLGIALPVQAPAPMAELPELGPRSAIEATDYPKYVAGPTTAAASYTCALR